LVLRARAPSKRAVSTSVCGYATAPLPNWGYPHVLRSWRYSTATAIETRPNEEAVELGTVDPNLGAATWVDTEEGQWQAQKQRQEALQRYRATWGVDPA